MASRSAGRPVIVVCAAAGPWRGLVRAVCAGIEEEGVPHVVHTVHSVPVGTAADLARSAAQRSPLDVGVGVDTAGVICVHHDKLETPLPGLTSGPDPEHGLARLLGHNAARIVVGLPLKSW